MIPKIIHYCWFGHGEKPNSVKKCIESWRKFCPDYEIKEWTEDDFDVNINLYCQQAYESRKWAFVSDYARLWIVYNYGGVYLDTDVELVRSYNPLLKHKCFVGRQPGFQANTGAGFGSEKGHPVVKIMMDDYNDIPFIKENGEMDLWTCPHRNSQWLFKNGLKRDDSYQEIADVAIYPIEYFSPKDAWTRSTKRTKNTYSIHHCDGTWNSDETNLEHKKRFFKIKIQNGLDSFIHLPNRTLKFMFGKNYEKLKTFIKGNNNK